MERVDIYASVHKGLRSELFTVASQVGRTDFRSPVEVVALNAAIRRLFGFLEEHAAHEDAMILPEIGQAAPWIFAELTGQHSRLDGLQSEIEGIVERLEEVAICERVSLGNRLARRFNVFLAEQLQHMEQEETVGNRTLWAHRSDEQLLALHRALIESIPAVRLLEWAELMTPALSAPELELVYDGLRGILPDDALATVPAFAIRGAAA